MMKSEFLTENSRIAIAYKSILNENYDKTEDVDDGSNESNEDSPEYRYYVIVDYGNGWKIHCGNEFKEDAIYFSKPDECPRTANCKIKVVSRITLKKYGLDANNDNDWMKGLPDGIIPVDEGVKDILGKATDFLDYTYTDPETGKRKINWKEIAIDAGLLGATAIGTALAAPTMGASGIGAASAGTALASNMTRRAAAKALMKGAVKSVAKGVAKNKIFNKVGDALMDNGHTTLGSAAKLYGNISALKLVPGNVLTHGAASKIGFIPTVASDTATDFVIDKTMKDGKLKDFVKNAKDIVFYGASSPMVDKAFGNGIGTVASTLSQENGSSPDDSNSQNSNDGDYNGDDADIDSIKNQLRDEGYEI